MQTTVSLLTTVDGVNGLCDGGYHGVLYVPMALYTADMASLEQKTLPIR